MHQKINCNLILILFIFDKPKKIIAMQLNLLNISVLFNRIIELSNYRIIELSNYRIIELSNYRIIELSKLQQSANSKPPITLSVIILTAFYCNKKYYLLHCLLLFISNNSTICCNRKYSPLPQKLQFTTIFSAIYTHKKYLLWQYHTLFYQKKMLFYS
jgi:hypothetical protein